LLCWRIYTLFRQNYPKMIKQLFRLSIAVILFSACNNSEKTSGRNQGSDSLTEVSDADFNEIVQSSDAKILTDTGIKYETVTAQGPARSQLITLIAEEGSLAGCSALPTSIGHLNSGSRFDLYKFTQSMSAEAGYMGFKGSIGKKELLIVQDYVRFKNVECNGDTKRVGIGLRCFIHVKGIKSRIEGSLPTIAANVQLDRASATFSLVSLGFGIGGDQIVEGLPVQGEYNVENFGKVETAFYNVLKTLKNDNSTLTIDPVELPKQ
jgi:hypothetical protein